MIHTERMLYVHAIIVYQENFIVCATKLPVIVNLAYSVTSNHDFLKLHLVWYTEIITSNELLSRI